jgi:hypothetical protein
MTAVDALAQTLQDIAEECGVQCSGGLLHAWMLRFDTGHLSEIVALNAEISADKTGAAHDLLWDRLFGLVDTAVLEFASNSKMFIECGVCLDWVRHPHTNTRAFACGHTFCASCCDSILAPMACPACRSPLTCHVDPLLLNCLASALDAFDVSRGAVDVYRILAFNANSRVVCLNYRRGRFAISVPWAPTDVERTIAERWGRWRIIIMASSHAIVTSAIMPCSAAGVPAGAPAGVPAGVPAFRIM